MIDPRHPAILQAGLTDIRADDVRVACPLFQEEGSGSTPTSALQLRLYRIDFELARELNRLWHSTLPRIGDPARLMKAGVHFAAEYDGLYYGVGIWSHPANRKLPQSEWLELRRLAIGPEAPRNAASRMLRIMATLIKRDRPEVTRLISYQDLDAHTGGIYRAAGWTDSAPVTPFVAWNKPSRRRPPDQRRTAKQRWEKVIREEPNGMVQG